MKPNEVIPPVHIEKVIIKGQSHSWVRDITVPPGISNLEIKYTATSFRFPKKVRFKYKLTGFDADWEEVGTRRTAFYTNLPPGHYNFRVIACNNDGVWNRDGASLRLKILPTFFQTDWFKLLLIFVGAVVIYIFLVLRTRSIEGKRLKLKQEVERQTPRTQRST